MRKPITSVTKKLKKNKKYKELKKILTYLIGTPNFTDNIKEGVSFKYYMNENLYNYISDNSRQNLKEYILNSLPKVFNIEVKIIKYKETDSDSVLDHYHYWKNLNSLRILVRERRKDNEG